MFYFRIFLFIVFSGAYTFLYADDKVPSLNMDNLRESIAQRTRLSWGSRDEKFKDFSKDMVIVEKKIPLKLADFPLFAVKVKLLMPLEDIKEDYLFLLVDSEAKFHFSNISHLSTGESVFEEAFASLKRLEKLPDYFGATIFKQKKGLKLDIVSDPFCPHCRKAWAFFNDKKKEIKSIRLVHFPLNSVSELVCMALMDAEKRNFKVFEMVDFAYQDLKFAQEASIVTEQFLKAFPELKESWGEDGSAAVFYLESLYKDELYKERIALQSLGLDFTPVFFIDDHMIEGFQKEKIKEYF